MPKAAPKPCATCGVLVHDGSARCVAHKPVQWLARPEVKRVTGRRLQAMREALFAREPFCRECAKLGRRVLAKIRDHITPLAEDGNDDDSNIQPLCRSCSDIKTAQESQRGRGHQMSTAPQLETGRVPLFSRAQVAGVGGVKP